MEDPDFSALWAAFRGKDRDRVIVGVAAAFAHVATANGTVEAAETTRFLEVVRGSRLAPWDVATAGELSRAFEALTRAMVARPEQGRSESLRVLGDFGFDPMRSEIIWSAARVALVADAALDAAERGAAKRSARHCDSARPSVDGRETFLKRRAPHVLSCESARFSTPHRARDLVTADGVASRVLREPS
jgi:tellurite resistance protein